MSAPSCENKPGTWHSAALVQVGSSSVQYEFLAEIQGYATASSVSVCLCYLGSFITCRPWSALSAHLNGNVPETAKLPQRQDGGCVVGTICLSCADAQSSIHDAPRPNGHLELLSTKWSFLLSMEHGGATSLQSEMAAVSCQPRRPRDRGSCAQAATYCRHSQCVKRSCRKQNRTQRGFARDFQVLTSHVVSPQTSCSTCC